MMILITTLSFFLEATISIYIPFSTHWYNLLFTLVALMLCSRYFSSIKYYYWYCFIVGILYDIVFTNTLFFHAIIFILIGYLYQKIGNWFSDTWYNFFITIALMIFVYRFLSYLVLLVVGYIAWSPDQFLKILLASFLCNILYGGFLYGIDIGYKHIRFYKK